MMHRFSCVCTSDLLVSSSERLTVQGNLGNTTSAGTLHHIYPGLCFILGVGELLHLEQAVGLSSTAGGISLDLGLVRDGREVFVEGTFEYLFRAVCHITEGLWEGVE